MDTTSGAYRITTMASTYLIDLDRAVLRREPRNGQPEGSLLRRDDELVTLLEVIECTVGRPMALLIDLHVLGVAFMARYSTPVLTIDPGPSPGAMEAVR